MTLRKRCKIYGKLTGKGHNCPGFKETVSCPKYGKKTTKKFLIKIFEQKMSHPDGKNDKMRLWGRNIPRSWT